MNVEKHPVWFKMKLERRELIAQLPPDAVTTVLLACFDFLETGKKPSGLSAIESVAFSAFFPDLNDAWGKYVTRIENGSKGGRKPNGSICNQMKPNGTEGEIRRRNQKSEGEERESMAPPEALPAPTKELKPKIIRHKHGKYGWVKLSDEEYSRLLNDLGKAEFERCIAYIDESAQSTGNKNKWRDWNLVIRRCSKDGWGLTAVSRKPAAKTQGYVYDYGDPDTDILGDKIR